MKEKYAEILMVSHSPHQQIVFAQLSWIWRGWNFLLFWATPGPLIHNDSKVELGLEFFKHKGLDKGSWKQVK